MGAAGRDFHVFNTCYRDNPGFEVVAFTATQIPHIDDRRYPAALAGANYPDGIPIHPEEELDVLLDDNAVDEVVFAYSDVSNAYVEDRRKQVEAHGVEFSTFDVDASMLRSSKPVIAIVAVRTGCGKSQTSRRITQILRELGKKTVAVRHPMPYGDLAAQAAQRFATYEDLDSHDCTIEEREEYEPHLDNGVIVYAGVDYAATWRVPKRRRTSSSGMVVTMTRRSTCRTCGSRLPIRIDRETNSNISRAPRMWRAPTSC